MSLVVNKALVAHTRGYKFIFIRSHHMKEVEKNEIKRLSDRPDAIRHQQADLSLVEAADKYAELEKRKPRWKQKLLACVKFIAKN